MIAQGRERHIARLCRLTVALALGLAVVGPSEALAAPVSLVAWTGSQTAVHPARGVILHSNGHGKLLISKGNDRKTGDVKVAGNFNPSPSHLAEIRSAAQAAMSGSASAVEPNAADGFYGTAVVKVGGSKRALVGSNKLPSKLAALVEALNKAIPENAKLARHGAATRRLQAHRADFPAAVDCPPGQSPTSLSKDLSLQEAAALGIVTLSPKGVPDGDSIQVDAEWQPIHARTKAEVNIEVIPPPESSNADWASAMKATIEQALAGYKIQSGPEAGTPVEFKANVIQRKPGSGPTPCYHQIQLRGKVHDYDYTQLDPGHAVGGDWWYQPISWPHEYMHLVGLPDRYTDFFVANSGQKYKLPENGLQGAALAQALSQLGVDPKSGSVQSIPNPGYAGNLMADGKKLFQSDLKLLELHSRNTITIHAQPGDLLLNKNSGAQNMGVGYPLTFTVRKGGGKVHLKGLSAYCIDQTRHIPAEGEVFDVLGPAGVRPEPGMQALTRVLAALARRGPAVNSDIALSAIYRVTEDRYTNNPEAVAILKEAGVPQDPNDYKYNSPHFTDPNAGSRDTASVSTTGVFPTPPRAQDPVLPRPQLRRVRLLRKRVRITGRRTLVVLRVRIRNASDLLKITLQRRRGRRWRRSGKRQSVPAVDGKSLVQVALRLRPGRWRLVVKSSTGKKKVLRFTARKRGRRRRG